MAQHVSNNCSSKCYTVLLLSSHTTRLACTSLPPLLHPNAAAVSCHTGVPTVPGVHFPSSPLFHWVSPARLGLPPTPLSDVALTA
eukprot:5853237-Pyramimonas_sp.AAC.1